jgi:hypothetical protein
MRFAIRFTGVNRAMRILGLTPTVSWVEVEGDGLRVHMGRAFSFDAPLANVRGAQRDDRRVWGWGVHGWRGKWLVNGSSSGLVRIDLAPPVRARTGPFPITVRELTVSVEDPDGLVAALSEGSSEGWSRSSRPAACGSAPSRYSTVTVFARFRG